MGLEADMSVFEFAPGNGWYTKLLAPVLKDSGSLTIGYPHEWLADLSDLISTPPHGQGPAGVYGHGLGL